MAARQCLASALDSSAERSRCHHGYFSNRSYAVLNVEVMRARFQTLGPMARSLFDLSRPSLDWVKLPEAMGAEASREETVNAFSHQFVSAP